MAQHDYLILNGTGQEVRNDINGALAAIVSHNSGASEPAVTFPGMWWLDTSMAGTGKLRIRNAQDEAWLDTPTGTSYLTVSGGAITGDLEVTGNFDNPAFDKSKSSNIGPVAPSPTVPGMLWYDTLNAPGTMRIRDRLNGAWLVAQATENVVFTDSVAITAADDDAALVLTAGGQTRQIRAKASTDRLEILTPAGTVIAYVTGAGDIVLNGASVTAAIAALQSGKQNTLGYTPMQTHGNAFTLTRTGGHTQVTIDVTTIGYLYTSMDGAATVPPATFGAVGTFHWMRRNRSLSPAAASWPGGGLIDGSQIVYAINAAGGGTGSKNPAGTYRNMSASVLVGATSQSDNVLAIRVA